MKVLCSKNLNCLFLLLLIVVSFVQNLDSKQFSKGEPKNFKEMIKKLKTQSLIESDKLFVFGFIQEYLEESLLKSSTGQNKEIIDNINAMNDLFQDKIQIKFYYFLNNDIDNSFIFLIKNGQVIIEKQIEDIQNSLNIHNLINLIKKGNLERKILKQLKAIFTKKKQNIRKEKRINMELIEKEVEPKSDDNKNAKILIKSFVSLICAVLTGVLAFFLLKYSVEWATTSKCAINRGEDEKMNNILYEMSKDFDFIFVD